MCSTSLSNTLYMCTCVYLSLHIIYIMLSLCVWRLRFEVRSVKGSVGSWKVDVWKFSFEVRSLLLEIQMLKFHFSFLNFLAWSLSDITYLHIRAHVYTSLYSNIYIYIWYIHIHCCGLMFEILSLRFEVYFRSLKLEVWHLNFEVSSLKPIWSGVFTHMCTCVNSASNTGTERGRINLFYHYFDSDGPPSLGGNHISNLLGSVNH